jgi:hypothetical protein
MNYRDVALHLAKHCRKSLGGVENFKPYDDLPEIIVVTEPIKAARSSGEDMYSFFIRHYARGNPFTPDWAALIHINKQKDVQVIPRGHVPRSVLACLQSEYTVMGEIGDIE